jgi:UDP-3-O-[3-hydroxymyristoyl] N-acetylglucosamine deacetylase/3-hydroxyacyl-[acyl-carrier-protein] dehydratase
MTNSKQTTLQKVVECNGIGLHSGKHVEMRLRPAPINTGIVFIRTDLPGEPKVRAITENITGTLRATTLKENGAEVSTIEHLMAAFAMKHVDNCFVEMSSIEPPVGDGSAETFVEAIDKAGIVEQAADRVVYVVDKEFTYASGDKFIKVEPYDGFKISFTSINPHPLLGRQELVIEDKGDDLLKNIAPARTVAFEEEIAKMQKMGLGLGGNLENVVVFGKDKILSKPRFDNELIRHKILDVIGDMYLLGPIKAHITGMKSGHAFNDNVSRQIAAYRNEKKQAAAKSTETINDVGSKHMITLDITEIQKILPHRYPMLLVDRIVELEPMKRAVGIKNISFNEPQFMGHFPGNPIMPGVLLIEAMAQVGGVTMLYPKENRGKIAVFGKIDKVRFRRQIVPGDQLRTTAIITKVKGTMGIAHCEGTVDGELACEGDFFFALMENKK